MNQEPPPKRSGSCDLTNLAHAELGTAAFIDPEAATVGAPGAALDAS
jgi:hypothetical protein